MSVTVSGGVVEMVVVWNGEPMAVWLSTKKINLSKYYSRYIESELMLYVCDIEMR